MSGWELPLPEEVNIEDRTTTFDNTPVAEGTYNLTLLPASQFDEAKGRLNIATAIADGDSKGRRVFPTLPRPKSKSDWPNQVIKRFANATGAEFLPGESAADFLNRLASNGSALYSGRLYHRPYKAKDGSDKIAVELDFQSIGVATI